MIRNYVFVYKQLSLDTINGIKADITELLFGTKNFDKDPIHKVSFDGKGLISYQKVVTIPVPPDDPPGNNPPKPAPPTVKKKATVEVNFDRARALVFARNYFNQVNISIDSFPTLKKLGLSRWFPQMKFLGGKKVKESKQWQLYFQPLVRGSNLRKDWGIPIEKARLYLWIGNAGLEGLKMNFLPLITRSREKPNSNLSMYGQKITEQPMFNVSGLELGYEIEPSHHFSFIFPHYKTQFGKTDAYLIEYKPPQIVGPGITTDPRNKSLKVLKDMDLPDVKMNRIILHWTVTDYKFKARKSIASNNYNPTLEELKGYHFHVDGAGKVHADIPIEYNKKPAYRHYAAHVKRLNTQSIGVAVDAMLEASNGDRDSGPYPMTLLQWQNMAKAVAELSDYYQIPVSRATILCHGEVTETLKIPQGKWDPCVLPWEVAQLRANQNDPAKKISQKDLDARLYEIFELHSEYRSVGDKFRRLVYQSKKDKGVPIVSGGYLLELEILGKVMNCINFKGTLYCQLRELKEKFQQSGTHVYSKSKSNTYKEIYHLDSIALNQKEVKGVQVHRIGGHLFVKCEDLAKELGTTLNSFDYIKKAYVIK